MATERVSTTNIVLKAGPPAVAIVASRTVLQRAEARGAPMSRNIAEARVAVVCLADIPLTSRPLRSRIESWLAFRDGRQSGQD